MLAHRGIEAQHIGPPALVAELLKRPGKLLPQEGDLFLHVLNKDIPISSCVLLSLLCWVLCYVLLCWFLALLIREIDDPGAPALFSRQLTPPDPGTYGFVGDAQDTRRLLHGDVVLFCWMSCGTAYPTEGYVVRRCYIVTPTLAAYIG